MVTAISYQGRRADWISSADNPIRIGGQILLPVICLPDFNILLVIAISALR
jgi:hypothetical protein